MIDQIEKIDSSRVQHGKLNDRIYLMHLAESDAVAIPTKLVHLAQKKDYTKIFAKVPSTAVQHFQKYNFFKEAYIPEFYHGKTGMYCLSKFFDSERAEIPLQQRLEIWKIIQLTKTKAQETKPATPTGLSMRELDTSDSANLVQLYKTVFKSYPFPIFDEDFIQKCMQDNVRYYGAFQGDKLVGACAAEINSVESNAEMTDFAVHPDSRSKNIALLLLFKMESDMRQLNLHTLYTIARAISPGINITFAKAGYSFGGTLVNNTNIGGNIESMNVWYKTL